MSRILAITNQKGGVGKTTTAVNLAAALAKLNKKVLLVDMDPQGNASVSLGVDKDDLDWSLYELLLGEGDFSQVVHPSSAQGSLMLLPSNGDLTAAEVKLLTHPRREQRLKDILLTIKSDFDAIIIDCPPSLNMLTLNAMVAADGLLIPVQCEYFALEGLSSLTKTYQQVQSQANPQLKIDGVLRTMYDRRNRLSNDVSNELVAHFGTKVLQTVIPRNVRLAEAPSHGEAIFQYDGQSLGALSYLALANELVRKKIL